MRVVIQRVKNASVRIQEEVKTIARGFLVLVAASHSDTPSDAKYLAKKIANLRIMPDEKGLMNHTLKQTNGEVLIVSQFTLFARTRKGNRPSFIDAAKPDKAKKLYQEFVQELKLENIPVKTGKFGEYMLVSLINDGPVTIIIDSKEKEESRKQ